MADVDFTKLSRAQALKTCQDVFGMDAADAEEFVALARGDETTTKSIAISQIKRDRLGRFAKKVGGYGSALATGVLRGARSSVTGYAGSRAHSSVSEAGDFMRGLRGDFRAVGRFAAGAVAGTLASAAAGSSVDSAISKVERGKNLLRTKRDRRRADKLENLARRGTAVGLFIYGNRHAIRTGAHIARSVWRAYRQSRHSRPMGTKLELDVPNVIEGKYRFAQRMLTHLTFKGKRSQSYDELRRQASDAFYAKFSPPNVVSEGVPYAPRPYIYEVWPDYLICELAGKYYKVAYDSDLNFAEPGDWQTVERKIAWEEKQVSASAFVFKEQDGGYRWVLLSSNAFRDRDGQILSQKSLEQDVAQWDVAGAPADPLRWWHVALDDGEGEPHAIGLDLGSVDFRMVQGRTLIESGTFLDKEIGESVYNASDKLEASVGFRHPKSEPDADGVFHTIHIFERSLLPKGNASNPLTQLLVTE